MKILAISGSGRDKSTNTALLENLNAHAPHDVSIELCFDPRHLPIFSPDQEGSNTPASVQSFIEKIETSDGVIISSPEYVHSIPGGLKNAIDWLVSGQAIIDKPITLIHASHRGENMLNSLRLVLKTVSTCFNEDIFARFPLISKTPDEVQTFLSSTENQRALKNYLQEFSSFIGERQE